MDSTPDLPGKQTLDGNTLAGGVKRRSTHTRRNAAIILWLIGFMALVGASVTVSFHPAPWPLDLQTTRLQKDRKSTRLNSSHRCISYAVFCLKKKTKKP